MKSKFRHIFVTLPCMLLAVWMILCSETDAEKDKGATPIIKSACIYNAGTLDSPVVSAHFGTRLTFMGDNLGDVQQIWFNDQKANLNLSTVSSHSIVVDIPENIPGEVTNMVRFITSRGICVDYPFTVLVPAPRVDTMTCKYLAAGSTAILTGAYFIDDPNVPLTVTFPGNIPATIKSISEKALEVEMPENIQEGIVTVTSIHGTGKSSFNYLDSKGMSSDFNDMISLDNYVAQLAVSGFHNRIVASNPHDINF